VAENNRKPGLTRRRFLQVVGVAGLCAGLGISAKAALHLLYPQHTVPSLVEATPTIPLGIGYENLSLVPPLDDIWQVYTERQVSPPEMNEFLRDRRLITFSPNTLRRIKRQQLFADGEARTLVAALGDSTLQNIHLDFLRPEIKDNPALVRLGEFEESLGGVLHRYDILSQNDRLLGVVQGSTPVDLYTNTAICADGCQPNETLLQAVIRNAPAIAFVCTGRINSGRLNEFAAQFDYICRSLLTNAILPVIITAPLVLEIEGQPYPNLERWYNDPNPNYWEEKVKPKLTLEQSYFLPKAFWVSFYADAMALPNICPFQLLAQVPGFGFAIDDIHLSDHKAQDEQGTPLYHLDQPITRWSGSEALNYLVLSFLKDFDDQPAQA
jgi:hypothetical protein